MGVFVSIIVPCYNEQETIGSLLGAIWAQTYPRELFEVVVADGISGDQTREVIEAFRLDHPGLALRVVENVRRTIPSSLNLAVAAARGEVIVRLDAHSIPIPEYVARCVVDLETEKGSIVGGIWIIQPGGTSWIAQGIAAAAGHPIGAGDARYRLHAKRGTVDTVPFGAYRRSLIEQVGGYDESLLTNEDYEFNTRIRKNGGSVWLDPDIRSTYIARSTLLGLWQQYWRYGFWKFRMLLRYPTSLRWRQALPPVFVLSVLALGLLTAVWTTAAAILAAELVLYVLVLVFAGLDIGARARRPALVLGSILALITMHTAWGAGFLWSQPARLRPTHG
jgi:succinoglycan biosynthesis protein ExoA